MPVYNFHFLGMLCVFLFYVVGIQITTVLFFNCSNYSLITCKRVHTWTVLVAVLRIRDILVQIRIRGSIPLTNGFGSGSDSGSRSGSCYFRHWPSRHGSHKKNIFFSYYFSKLHSHHFSKVKSHEEVTEQWESIFFLLFLMKIVGSGDGSEPRTNGSGSVWPKIFRILLGGIVLLRSSFLLGFVLIRGRSRIKSYKIQNTVFKTILKYAWNGHICLSMFLIYLFIFSTYLLSKKTL
jgi:hypothetical protein